ncbi:MAG: NAD-dependent epimerase/dehydratase family protein [Promethearchaeota archaeon]|jgi:nucleoside-diphosphate-sugar epimerase
MMPKKNILITGASGSVGIKVFHEFYAKKDKYNITLFLRGSKKNKKLFKNYRGKLNIIWGDLRKNIEIEKAVANQDIILHIAAVIPISKESNPQTIHEVNVGGTQNIIISLLKQQIKPKIIYTSSVAVYGNRIENPIIKITDPIRPAKGDFYAESKIEAEKLIRNSGLDFCIFRLAYCASPAVLKFHPVMFRMPLNTSIEMILTSDIGKALANAIEREDIWGKTFNLGGGESCRIKYGDHLDDLYEIMGLGRGFMPKEAFSKEGYHCGFYFNDGVQELFNFRNLTLQDFYKEVKKWIGFKRHLTPLLRWFLRKIFIRKSEYYKEYEKEKEKS